jgi:hypothetical protein
MKTKRRAGLTALLLAILAPLVMLVGITPAQAATTYVKYPWSEDIYLVNDGYTVRVLSLAEWQALGQPTPSTVNWIPGSAVRRNNTSPSELFVWGPYSGSAHHLTLSEYQAMGSPTPESSGNSFYKYTWNNYVVGYTGSHRYTLRPEDWNFEGQPTPAYVKSLPGDSWCRIPSNGQIYMSNTTWGVPAMYVTAAMYAAAGSPSYVTC